MRPKVLIVDDDVFTLAALKRLLKPSFDCEGCSDPSLAYQVIQGSTAVDLAVLDVVMPNLDGWELLEQMRRFRPSVPVVMLSGDARPDTIIRAMRRGACDFVVKPFEDAQGLAERLSQAAAQSLSPNTITDVLAAIEDNTRPLPPYAAARETIMNEFQRSYLDRVMREASNNISQASRLSGIDRTNLRRLMAKFRKE